MIRLLFFIFIFCLSVAAVSAKPLAEGYEALAQGEVSRAQAIFSKARGEAGRLARARLSLTLGRPEEALSELDGESTAIRVTRLEALCQAGLYTQARTLLRQLEQEEHGNFVAPFDSQFYRFRGHIERFSGHPELARKNFDLAARRAKSEEQVCLVKDELASLWIEQGELEKAKDAYAETTMLILQSTDIWVLLSHLDLAFEIHYQMGDLASAASVNKASRQLNKAYQNPIKAALALDKSSVFAELNNNSQEHLAIKETVLREYLQAHAYRQAADHIRDLHLHYLKFGGEDSLERILTLCQDAIRQIPSGLWRQTAQLNYCSLSRSLEEQKADCLESYQDLIRSEYADVRNLAHQGLAFLLRGQGLYNEARRELEIALKTSNEDVMRRDRYWSRAKGSILIRLASLEKNRHDHSAALDFAERAIQENPGADWRYWRVEARHLSLMSAVESYDLERSKSELEAGLVDIENLPQASSKASALTTILSSLLLNQSVSDDVLEPGELLLAEYGDIASTLLTDAFQDTARTNRFVSYFDEWEIESLRKKDTRLIPFAPLYKGVFLESLGQLDEASLALESALKKAQESRVLPAQMLSELLLARVSQHRGNTGDATDHLTLAAEAAKAFGPDSARFYLLCAGSVQRSVGRLEQAQESFTLAIQAKPEKAWQAYYGRALTLERMGRNEDALEDMEKALEQARSSGLLVSLARLEAGKAKLLAALGNTSEAAALYAVAHSNLLDLGAVKAIYQVTSDYSECLAGMGREAEALKLCSRVLDQLSDWQALSYREAKPLFEQVIALSFSLGQQETALKYLQLSHSAELLDSVDLTELKTGDPKVETLLREVSTLKQRLVRLRQKSSELHDAEAQKSVGTILANTRQEFFVKMNELKRSEPDFENLVQLSGSQLSSIQELLSPQSALLEYFPAQNTLYVFVVTKDEFTLHQVSISRAELQELVEQYLEDLSDPGTDPAKLKENSARLRALLIDSAGTRLKAKSNLRIVPSGPIWDVSFSSLLNPQGKALVEDYEVSYVTSSDLARIRRTGTERSSFPQKPILVSGSEELKGARQEIENLAAKFSDALVLAGTSLNKTLFLAQVEDKDLIHIASHSTISSQSGQSYVQLGKERLTLEEIYGLKLLPSSLVVLSSCRSGVGTDPPAKEITSLASAFSVAGASTIISSRWRIDDKTTAEFFAQFYDSLMQRGQSGAYSS